MSGLVRLLHARAPYFCSLGTKRKTKETPKGGIFFLFFLIFPFSTSPFIRTDTYSTASQKPPQSPRPKKKTPKQNHQFQFHKGQSLQKGGGGWGVGVGFKASTTLGTLRGGSGRPAAGCVHTYHSYIINIMWHLKNQKTSKLTEH